MPGRIINRMYPKKLLVLVSAKRNRWYCRGCLGRPLGQLKLSEGCDKRLMRHNNNQLSWVQSQDKDSKGIFCIRRM